MSTLYYDIPINEIQLDNQYNIVQEIKTNIPHFDKIKAWLPSELQKCELHKHFDGILKDKVASTSMRVFKNKEQQTICRIKIEFVDNFRLTQQKREACWEYMNAQMTDGFGESYDQHVIPDVDEHYRIYL